jgi:hypothetical protein
VGLGEGRLVQNRAGRTRVDERVPATSTSRRGRRHCRAATVYRRGGTGWVLKGDKDRRGNAFRDIVTAGLSGVINKLERLLHVDKFVEHVVNMQVGR